MFLGIAGQARNDRKQEQGIAGQARNDRILYPFLSKGENVIPNEAKRNEESTLMR